MLAYFNILNFCIPLYSLLDFAMILYMQMVLLIFLKSVFNKNKEKLSVISMGMSGDYQLAIEQGSTMVRVGSAIFGLRN